MQIIDKNKNLQGVIDAAVNGGIAKYQEAFFSPNFLNEFPSHLLHVAKLQALMMDQVHVIWQHCIQNEMCNCSFTLIGLN